MRQGNMRDITIDDVKRIWKDKVEQTLKYIHHYHWDTNRFDEEEVQKRIAETQKKEREIKDHLKKITKEHLVGSKRKWRKSSKKRTSSKTRRMLTTRVLLEDGWS